MKKRKPWTMTHLLSCHFFVPRLWILYTSVAARCKACAHNNPVSWPQQQLGVQRQGALSFEDVNIDLTEIKPTKGNKSYLPGLICTYFGWVEALPSRTETSRKLVKALMELTVPQYRLPIMVGSDNEPGFLSRVVQGLQRP